MADTLRQRFIRHAARVLLSALTFYLRVVPLHLGKRLILSFCRKVLAPQLPPFAADVSITASTAKWPVMRCFQLGGAHHADVLSEWLLYTGTWQPALTHWLCRTLKPGDVFVDVGANTGYFSLLAAALVGEQGGVVAVEACPRTVARLQQNLALNPSLASRIRVVAEAAAEAAGKLTLYQHKRDALYNTTVAGAGAGGVPAGAGDVWSVLQKQGVGGFGGAAAASTAAATLAAVTQLASESSVWHEVRVAKRRLDEMVEAKARAAARVIKIDVEGGEAAVLRGMTSLLDEARDELEIVMELTPRWLALQGTSADEVLRGMRDRGYHAYILKEHDYEVAKCYDGEPLQMAPPRRMLDGDAANLGAHGQADIIFSRRDAATL